jgi:alpha-beta hydrolase superfamily lysophospholipase
MLYQGNLIPEGFPAPPSDWVYDAFSREASDGKTQLFGYVCSRGESFGVKGKEGAHRALFVIHGMGEHGGRYLPFASWLSGAVDSLIAFDHRGHGRSDGSRGHVGVFDDLVDDAAALIRWLHERLVAKHGKSEIHLFGHSLGGQVALRVLFFHPDLPLASATISAPLLGIRAEVPAAKLWSARLLSRARLGWLQMDTGLETSRLSRDPEVVRAYERDRLVHSKMTPRFFAQLTRAMRDTCSRRLEIFPPVLFQVPLGDAIVDPDKAIEFFNTLNAKNKELKTYPGFYHEGFHEPGKERFLADLSEFIRAHPARARS